MRTISVGTEAGLFFVQYNAQDGNHSVVRGPEELRARRVHALTGDREGGLYFLVDGKELWRTVGDRSRRLATSPNQALRSLALRGNDIYIGTEGAFLLKFEEDRFEAVITFNEVDGRENWGTPWGGPPEVRSMAFDPDGTQYVNVHVGGVVRGKEDEDWQPIIDIDIDVHQVVSHHSRHSHLLLVATGMRGLGVSHDRGDTWTFMTKGLRGSYCRAVTVAEENILVTCSDSHLGQHAAVYRRPLGAAPDVAFEHCRGKDLPEWYPDNINTFCLEAKGPNVAFATREGDLYLSKNVGLQWEKLVNDLPPVQALSLAAF